MKSSRNNLILTKKELSTPLGSAIAIGDNRALYLFEFLDCKQVERRIQRMLHANHAYAVDGNAHSIESIEHEFDLYFKNQLTQFQTPLQLTGTAFQKTVWQALIEIPYGQTNSYAELASSIKRPTAFRAVARANSTNCLAIIIPCHRVINSSGALGGYAGGISKKQWLLDFERNRHE